MIFSKLYIFSFLSLFFMQSSFAVSAGMVGVPDQARGAVDNSRGKRITQMYFSSQRKNYYLLNQPDVDSACRDKIYKCLSNYCGDVTAVPGQRGTRCTYTSETELYNYAMLCIQKDISVLLPQYQNDSVNRDGGGGSNTAANLCPKYIQQEVLSYLSMSNMADQLSKSRSSLCIQRKQELEAALACHAVSVSYGNETTSMLTSRLTDSCGNGVPGGSAEMVSRFANAGNLGANIWGWAEKIVSMEMNKKGADWRNAIDSILANYTNRMNLACGDNMKLNTISKESNSSINQNGMVNKTSFPNAKKEVFNNLWLKVQSMIDIYDSETANQVVQAGLTNDITTQNEFLSTSQMDNMQKAYKSGTKVFILSDSARCFITVFGELSDDEKSLVAQTFAGCVSR